MIFFFLLLLHHLVSFWRFSLSGVSTCFLTRSSCHWFFFFPFSAVHSGNPPGVLCQSRAHAQRRQILHRRRRIAERVIRQRDRHGQRRILAYRHSDSGATLRGPPRTRDDGARSYPAADDRAKHGICRAPAPAITSVPGIGAAPSR